MATVHRLAHEESESARAERQPRTVALAQHLAQSGPLTIADSFRLGAELATLLAERHAQGTLHLHVSLATTLLVEFDGRLVGVALEPPERSADDLPPERFASNRAYASPEQWQGHSLDVRSDLFSLGCVLYAMTTGSGPFDGATPEATAFEVCELAPQPVGVVNPRLSAWQAAIIMRLIAKDPEQRFATADEVAELLRMQQSATTILHRPLPRRRSDPTPRPSETPVVPSTSIAEQVSSSIAEHVTPSPAWSSPALERLDCTSVSEPPTACPENSSTTFVPPIVTQATTRWKAKPRGRNFALLVLLLAGIAAGWQLAAMFSDKWDNSGVAHADRLADGGKAERDSADAKNETTKDSRGVAALPTTVKYPVVSHGVLECTHSLGIPSTKFTVPPTTGLPRSHVICHAYLMDKHGRGPSDGTHATGHPPGGLQLYVLTDPNQIHVSLGVTKPVSIQEAIQQQWLALEALGGGGTADASLVGGSVSGMGADVAFVNLTDQALDIAIDGPLVVSAERGRKLHHIPLATLASLVSTVHDERTYYANQERIDRDASALLVAGNHHFKTPAKLGNLAEVIDDFHRQGSTTLVLTKGNHPRELLLVEHDQIVQRVPCEETKIRCKWQDNALFVLTKGSEPQELLVIEAGRIKGRLVGDDAKQEFASLTEREQLALNEQKPQVMADGLQPAAPAENKPPLRDQAFPDMPNLPGMPNFAGVIPRDVPKDPAAGDKKMGENEPGGKKGDKNPPIDEQLNKLVTFSYPRITLERAVQRVSAEIHVPYTIISRDLTQAGISRHHAIQLEVYHLTASECLHHILSLVDRSGRLTFVVRTRPDGHEEIAITTHAGIAERSEGRPGEF